MAEVLSDILEKILGIQFKNKGLLAQAFTHSSYAKLYNVPDYERLEFLGDSVVGMVVTDYLYKLNTSEQQMPEGELTKLRAKIVNEDSLYLPIQKLDISKYMLVGEGEKSSNIVQLKSKQADLFESLVGAIYLDNGYTAAKGFILKHLIESIDVSSFETDNNFKGRLQEHLQSKNKRTPEYKTLADKILDDNTHIFTQAVFVDGKQIAQAQGATKQEAEQLAAKLALEQLRAK